MNEFQAHAGEQGREFEALCRGILRRAGFDVDEKRLVVHELGIEVDIVATNQHGVTFWFECKGSWAGNRPGLLRTDSVKKAIADALLAHVAPGDYPPFVVLTTNLPREGLRGITQLAITLDVGALHDVIDVNEPGRINRLAAMEANHA